MPSPSVVELSIRVLGILGMHPGHALRRILTFKIHHPKGVHHFLFRGQFFEQIACPPVVTVACRNEVFVVLHEFTIAQNKFAIIPN